MSTGCVTAIAVEPERIVLRGTLPEEVARGAPRLAVAESPLHLAAGAPCVEAVIAEADPQGGFCAWLARHRDEHDRLYSRFQVGVPGPEGEPGAFFPGVSMPTELLGISAYDYPYPTAPTIKGLQVRWVEDALALGIGHAAINLNQANVMRPAPGDETVTYCVDGREYYFDEANLRAFDRNVKELSDHGVVVNLVLLNSIHWAGMEMDPALRGALLHPDYDPEGRISAFNVITEEGLAHYRAFVEFVAERYTRPDARYGRACGYIIGNEVNSGWVWCNAGPKTVEQYAQEHALAMRTAFYAARTKYAQARVYLSLDHLWTIAHVDDPLRCYKGQELVELLNAACVRDGNFDWSMAYHPYPESLSRANFWDDDTATNSLYTPRITFKNIEVLPRYLSQPHLLYDGRPRRIILSEQGLHSDGSEESELQQAAAYAFAYWRVERAPGIEAFIYHAHVDSRDEFGLNLGLRRRDTTSDSPNAPGERKPIYDVFRDIDGPRQEDLFRQARQLVGADRWR